MSITQPHLAELADVSINTLYKLERGQGNPSLEVLNKLAELFEKIINGLQKVREKLIEFKKQKKSEIVIMEDGKIIKIKPE